MKKTIIALFALAGVATAASVNTDTLIDNIKSELTLNDYTLGDSFTISFSIDTLGYSSNSANIIGLGAEFGTNTGIRIQSSTGLTSAYLGIRVNDSEAWKLSDTVWDATTNTNTLTLDSVTGVWLSMGAKAKEQANDLTGATMTLAYDAETKVSSFILNAGGVTNIVNYNNVIFNAEALTSKYSSTTWKDLSVSVTPAVPEPTTATLSLLALAGLAVRRRRK